MLPSSPSTSARRRPAQERSRERFDRVLDAAAALIGRQDLRVLTMTDIAQEAGMPVTAVYRYFPNKQAVLTELALRTFAHDAETLVTAEPDPDATVAELVAAGVREFWRRHQAEPYRIRLRAAIHADAELSALDLAESRRNAAVIAEVVGAATGRTDRAALERQALLVVELVDSLMSVAGRVGPDEAEALVAEFTAMAVRALAPPG